MQSLGLPGSVESFACDINDWGQIVGFFSTAANVWRAFVHDPNLGMQDLGPTHYDEGSCCVNNQGFVVGQFGSTQTRLCVSTWTARTGSQRLPLDGADFLRVSGLGDSNRYLVNVHYDGIRVLRRQLGERSESHLWESGRHVRCLTGRLCYGDDLRGRDIEAVGGWDLNKDGTILGMLKRKGSADWRAVLLEPIQ
jgi:probable HAF family extracellular repeat protein